MAKQTAKSTTTAKKAVSKTTTKKTTKKVVPTKTKTETKTETTEKPKRQRRVVNKDTILTSFDTMLSDLESQILLLKDGQTKPHTTVRYMKSLQKQVKQLKGDVSKNIKVKRQMSEGASKTSGFLKPVNVSKEVSSFAGWKQGELHSRVDVTKLICNYVKTNDLQNPSDRRQILPDKKLRTLLKLGEKEKDPLTYYSLQRLIQPHFV